MLGGTGLLLGETWYAEQETREEPVRGGLFGITGGLGPVFTGIADGLKGLTPGRSLVFAGTALLIGLAVDGGLAADGESAGDGATDLPSSPASDEPTPAASRYACNTPARACAALGGPKWLHCEASTSGCWTRQVVCSS